MSDLAIREEESIVSRLLRQLTAPAPALQSVSRLESGMSALRQSGVCIADGVFLGFLHAVLPRGLDSLGSPIDATTGVMATIASVALRDKDYSRELLNIGSQNIGIFAFRKTHDLIALTRRSHATFGQTTFAGEREDTTDVILQLARSL